jgi:hypothetical protein
LLYWYKRCKTHYYDEAFRGAHYSKHAVNSAHCSPHVLNLLALLVHKYKY